MRPYGSKNNGPWVRFSVLCALVCILGFFVTFLASSYSEDTLDGVPKTIVVTDRMGRIIEVAEKGTWCLRRTCTFLVKKIAVESAVQPITDNPKVRRLHYEVEAEIADPLIFLRTCGPRPGEPDNIHQNTLRLKDTVSYQLYEFNNARSKDLARFYNPLSHEQSQELESMLRAYLDEALKPKGVAFVRLRSWSVE